MKRFRTHAAVRPSGAVPARGPVRWLWSVVAVAVCAGFLAVGAPASALQPGKQSVVVSDNPVRTTPHVLDGYVSGFAQVGDIVVVVGNFTKVRTQADTTEIARTNIFAFQYSTGEITSFAPVVNGELMDVLATGDGKSVWIAGGFSTVNGVTQRGVAKLDVTTGVRDATFKTPAFDGRVHQVMLRGNRLYLTGRFNNVAGKPWPLLAAVNPVTGAQIPDVRLDISGPRNGGALSILRADITPDGSKLVAIGNFTVVNGASRTQIFMADLTTSPTSLANWSTTRFEPLCNKVFDSYMRDIDISPDGKYFAIATTGSYYAGTMCDASSRWEIAPTGDNQQPTWIDYTGGDTVTRVGVTDTAVYIGGHYSYVNNPFVGDAVGPGAVNREGLAALDPRNGLPTTWNPGRTRGYGVYSFWATDAGLWIGSDTDRISNYQYHGRMAFMPVKGGFSMPLDNAGALPADVYATGTGKDDAGTVLAGTALVKRAFNGSAVTSSTPVDTTQDVSTVRGSFMVDGKLYTGRSDGTFQMQTFDGTVLGAPSTVELNNLPAFVADLKVMTAMAFDPVTARMYYTIANDSRLFYRYFSSQSTTVGAERFVATGNLAGLSWRNVQGMFLSGGSLYVADSTGALGRWAWDGTAGTPRTGTRVAVSGPAVDGINWAGRDAFVFAGPTAPAPVPATDPAAAFSSTLAAHTVSVDAGASSGTSSIASYAWDFGDGAKATGRTAVHPYAAVGTYSVRLTVTDTKGKTATATRLVRISDDVQAPGAVTPADAYGAAVFNDQPDLYWRLGEASGPSAADASGANNPGTYRAGVTLGAAGALKGVNNTAGTFNGSNGLVSSNASFSNPGPYSTEVWFKTTSTLGGSLISFGSAATGNSASHDRKVYMKNDGTLVFGVYPGREVTLTTPQPYNNGQWHHVVATQSAAGMRLYVDGVLTGQNTEPGAQNYTGYWRVGGDSTWSGATSRYIAGTLDEPAVYGYALGADAVAKHYQLGTGTVPNTPPKAAFTAQTANLDLQVDGSGSSDADGSVIAYAWDFGDGGTGTGAGASHSYAAAGTYTVKLTVTDDGGATGTLSQDVSVTAPVVNAKPVASFIATMADLSVQLDGSGSTDSDGTVTSYDWNFGDGQTGSGVTTSHAYASAGTYTITLTVTDDRGGTGSTSQTVTAKVPPANQPPTAQFSSAVANLAVDVDASASTDVDGTINSYAWNFGDGAQGAGVKASHTYTAPGTFTVTLTVTDNKGASTSTAQPVTVSAAPAPAPVSFRAAAQTNVNSTAPSLVVPPEVQAGNGLMLIATVNTTATTVGDPAGVTGWRLVEAKSGGSMQTLLWVKTAASNDGGKTVSVPLSAIAKTALQITAYQGVTGPDWIAATASSIDSTSVTAHTTPQVPVTTAGSTLVSYWADKSSSDDSWSAPQVTVRATTTGTGGGRITSVVGDSGPLPVGTAGQLTATAAVSAKAAMWSIVLRPGS